MVSGTAVSGEGKAQAGMGVACADFDGDSRLDLHVTNFYNEYNALYLNQGNLSFIDAIRDAGLAEPSRPMLGFGTQALDVDLDGWPDLFVTNGHIDEKYSQGGTWKMAPQLYRNRGRAVFDDVSADAGAFFQAGYVGRAAARLDWNRDGRPDIVVVHQDRPVGLLRNDTRGTGRRIGLKLRGVTSNRDGLGARVTIVTSQGVQVHELCGGDGYFASNEPGLIAGLGSDSRVDVLEIRWPGGHTDRWTDLKPDLLYTLIEGHEPREEPFEQPISSSGR
jgi:hypothetical protein